MTAAHAKFTFDLDLTRHQDHAGFLSDAAREALQQQSRADGYAEGFAAGERSAAVAAAQALGAGAASIAHDAVTLLAGLTEARATAEREAVMLAVAIARKLAAGLVAAQPAAELEALLVDCLGSLGQVPHLAIRCHPDLADQLRDIASERIAASGFAGRLVVIGDPDQALGDGRIEWADGGLVRDMDAILAAIDSRISAYLAARGNNSLEEIKP